MKNPHVIKLLEQEDTYLGANLVEVTGRRNAEMGELDTCIARAQKRFGNDWAGVVQILPCTVPEYFSWMSRQSHRKVKRANIVQHNLNQEETRKYRQFVGTYKRVSYIFVARTIDEVGELAKKVGIELASWRMIWHYFKPAQKIKKGKYIPKKKAAVLKSGKRIL